MTAIISGLKAAAVSALNAVFHHASEGNSFKQGASIPLLLMALFGYDEEGQIIPGYRGPLSTWAEWHAIGIGFYHGFSENKKIPHRVMDSNSDVAKEPHMAKAGFPLGVAAKYALLIAAFKYGVEPFYI